MSTEENKAKIRRVYEESINTGNMAVVDELYSPDHKLYASPDTIHGSEGFKQFVMMYRSAFPDLHFIIDDLFAEAGQSRVSLHCTWYPSWKFARHRAHWQAGNGNRDHHQFASPMGRSSILAQL